MSTDFIYAAENALPDAFCDALVALFEAHPGRGAGITTGGVDAVKKTSTDLSLDAHPDLAELRQILFGYALKHLTEYFLRYPMFGSITPVISDKVTGKPTEITMDNCGIVDRNIMKMLISQAFRSGIINIQKYQAGVGNYHHWHAEIAAEPSFEALHRVVFWLFYLNDVEVGGETEFYFQKLKMQPRKGTVIIAPAGFTHTHRGNIPLSGDKYVTTSWLLFNRAGQLQAPG
jgi:hypothetical protein